MQKNVDHGDVLFTGLSKALKLIHDYFSTKKKELKLKMHIAHQRVFFMVSHTWDPYSVLYYSI